MLKGCWVGPDSTIHLYALVNRWSGFICFSIYIVYKVHTLDTVYPFLHMFIHTYNNKCAWLCANVHCSPYRYCRCKFSRCLLRIRFFEGRWYSAWQRHSWNVCHTPAESLSRLFKVGNGSESTVRVTDWGLIEFYHFSSIYFENFRTVIS